jgi:hypothetical protein
VAVVLDRHLSSITPPSTARTWPVMKVLVIRWM